MNHRISIVNNIKIHNVVDSAIASFGDSMVLSPEARILALQRESPIFFEHEGDNIDEYPTFTKKIENPFINESINVKIINKSPYIKVNSLYALSLTASAILNVGSTQVTKNEARVKIFRNLSHM